MLTGKLLVSIIRFLKKIECIIMAVLCISCHYYPCSYVNDNRSNFSSQSMFFSYWLLSIQHQCIIPLALAGSFFELETSNAEIKHIIWDTEYGRPLTFTYIWGCNTTSSFQTVFLRYLEENRQIILELYAYLFNWHLHRYEITTPFAVLMPFLLFNNYIDIKKCHWWPCCLNTDFLLSIMLIMYLFISLILKHIWCLSLINIT